MPHLRVLAASVLCAVLASGCAIELGGDPAPSTTTRPTTTTATSDGGGLAAACRYWEATEPQAKAAFGSVDVLAGTVLDPDDPQAFAEALGADLEARIELFSELRSGYLLASDDPDPEVAAAARRAYDGLGVYLDELQAIQDDLESASGTAELSELFARIDAAHTAAGSEVSDALDTVGDAAGTEPGCAGWLEAVGG